MNKDILAELLTLINEEIPQQEGALMILFKAQAMLKVILASDLKAYSKATLHSYLWLLGDLAEQVKGQTERLLHTLAQAESLVEPPDDPSSGTICH